MVNAVTGTTALGSLILNQSATGGAGGLSSGGLAGTAGSATSTLTSNRGYGDFHCRFKAKFNANGVGATVVYDSVGKDTFAGSLKSLKRRGVLVGCGTASGAFPPIDAMQMVIQGSVYFTRPALADYYADPAERAELSGQWFDHLAAGRIKVEIGQRYTLDQCAQAHRDLEAGSSIGSSVFVL